MNPVIRRIVTSKLLLTAVVLVAVYALLGFFLAPYLIQRYVPRYVHEELGAEAALGKVRVNPFLLTLDARDFRLDQTPRQPLATFGRLFVDFELASAWHRAWTFSRIELDDLHVNAEIARDGRFNLAQLADRWSRNRKTPPNQSPPRVIVSHFALRSATFDFTDRMEPKPAHARSEPINLDVTDLATVPDREGRYTISAALPQGASLAWQGQLSLQPIASKGSWHVKGVKLATAWQFFRDELRIAEPQGQASVTGTYEFSYNDGAARLVLQKMNAQLTGLSMKQAAAQRPLLALKTVEATDARFDLAKRELVLPRVKLANGSFSASAADDGTLDWQSIFEAKRGTKKAPEKSSPFKIQINAADMQDVAVHYTDHTRAKTLEYAAALSGNLKLDVASAPAGTRVAAENVTLNVRDFAVSSPNGGTLATIKAAELAGGRFDTSGRTVSVDNVTFKGGNTTVARARNGRVELIDAFEPARSRSSQDSSSAHPWQYAIHAMRFEDFGVALADDTYTPAVAYDLQLSSATLSNLASESKTPMEIKAALRVRQGGTVNASGTLTQDFKQANAKFEMNALSLVPLRSVLAHYAVLDLKTGTASASGQATYRSGGKPMLRLEGGVRIANLLVNEADTGDRFVAWKTLTADNVRYLASPARLFVNDVEIEEPGAKIVVNKDRSVNVTQVMKRSAHTPENAQRREEKAASDELRARVGRIRLQRGTLDYADNSLVLPFATRVSSLNGAIVGISSDPRSRAELKLEGEIPPNGSASAVGSLKPADPKSFLDIEAKFDNVEMPPLSPYTATFAGRKIAAGRLWLDVHYKIVDSQMLGDNKIEMANFQLGERVQAPNALNLPLDLAVALLKDSQGRINLAVPVRGDVGKPEFDYGALIRDAIANTLKRIITAPFRLLAGLFGGRNAEELQDVDFNPGRAQLIPSEREQLRDVAEGLKRRPQLKLVVHGAYDPNRDAHALREDAARRDVVQSLGVKLEPGEEPGPIAYDDPRTQRALEKAFDARAGENAVQKFAVEYAKKTGKEPRRVNPVLATFHRGRGDRDFYEALFNRLVQMWPLPENTLSQLAEQRARAIAEFVAQAGIDAGRITIGDSQKVEDESKPLAAKLSLAAT